VPLVKRLSHDDGKGTFFRVRAVHCDPHKIVSAGDDGTVKIWEVDFSERLSKMGRCLRELKNAGVSPVLCMQVTTYRIAVGHANGVVLAYAFGSRAAANVEADRKRVKEKRERGRRARPALAKKKFKSGSTKRSHPRGGGNRRALRDQESHAIDFDDGFDDYAHLYDM
jgi:hypothetical protein